MIERIALKNIRIFANDEFPFAIRPLTLLCGTNSSGKSTLLKSILLLKQSQGSRSRYESPQGEIQFIGPQLDLGNFYNFVSNNNTDNDATISVTLDVTDGFPSFFPWQFRKPQVQTRNPFIISSSFTFGVPHRQKPAGSEPPHGADYDAAAPLCLIKHASYNITGVNVKLKDFTARLANEALSPDETPRYELLVPKSVLRLRGDVSRFTLGEVDGQYRFATVMDGMFPATLVPPSEVVEASSSQSLRKQVRHLYMAPDFEPTGPLFVAGRVFEATMSRLGYVGPARAAAKRYYYSTRDSFSGIDPTGEFLPHTLLAKKDQDVEYHLPGVTHDLRQEKLPVALARWIQYMRDGKFMADRPPAKEYKVDTPDNIMLSVKLRAGIGEKLFPLADIGFGYSQILPILINGLLAERGSTVIIEQPELHLNPALQVRIAEFFVALQRAGKQIVVETHSEHIVNTIRVLAAEDESSRLWENVSILYFHASKERPLVRELSMQADGTIPEWPREFFGETLELTTRLLSAQGRFMERKVK